jgi:hypothetical protein
MRTTWLERLPNPAYPRHRAAPAPKGVNLPATYVGPPLSGVGCGNHESVELASRENDGPRRPHAHSRQAYVSAERRSGLRFGRPWLPNHLGVQVHDGEHASPALTTRTGTGYVRAAHGRVKDRITSLELLAGSRTWPSMVAAPCAPLAHSSHTGARPDCYSSLRGARGGATEQPRARFYLADPRSARSPTSSNGSRRTSHPRSGASSERVATCRRDRTTRAAGGPSV